VVQQGPADVQPYMTVNMPTVLCSDPPNPYALSMGQRMRNSVIRVLNAL